MIASVAKGFATKSRVAAARAMSTVRYSEYGHPLNVLKIEPDDKQAPLTSGQVALKFLAAPINVADLSQIHGHYAIRPPFPAVAGNEGVAVVTAVGPDVTSVQVDDRVIPAVAGFGTWRSFAVAQASEVLKISDTIALEDAATLSVNPATALRLLTDFSTLQAGDVVIQNGANSAVGQAVIQLAHLRGVQTINVVRDDGEFDQTSEHLKSLGATLVVTSDYVMTHKFKELVNDLPLPKLALNCVGGASAMAIAKTLGKQGVMVTYGGMAKEPVQINTGALIFQDITLRGFWLSEWVKNATRDEREAMLHELATLVEEKKLRTWIETYKFADFDAALQAALTRSTKRKIVLLME